MFLDQIWQALDPVAFSVGPVTVRWYALAYILGVILGSLGIWHTSKQWGLKIHTDAITVIMTAMMIGIIIGGRLGYVLAYNLDYYLSSPIEIVRTWTGGMSFHGGLVGAVVATFVACRLLRINYWTYFDLMAIWAPLGIFLGRCANFANGELWGKECDPSVIPWAVRFYAGGDAWRHPSQLYEALLEGAILLAVMIFLSRKRPVLPQWFFSALFLSWYGASRILLEFVRVPDLHIGYIAWGWLTVGQVLSLPMLVIGAVWLWFAVKRGIPQHAFLDGRDKDGDCDEFAGDIPVMLGIATDEDDESDANDTNDDQ